MKAHVLHGIGDLRWEEAEKPVPREAEVLVRVERAGICGSDIPRIYKTGAHNMPLIPGHEFAGTVVKTGVGTDEKWNGKRVGIFPLIPCGKCPQCKNKRYEMCTSYSYLGSRTDGGFAEFVRVPEWNLIELPENVSFEAAAMLEPASVAIHAIRRVLGKRNLRIQTEKTEEIGMSFWEEYSDIILPKCAAVLGLGTIGLLTAMHLKAMGVASVYVLGNKDLQRETAKEFGIPEKDFCDTRSCDAGEWVMDKTHGVGAEVFFECIGKAESIVQAIDLTAPGGNIMLVGNPASDIVLPKENYWKILRRQLTLSGTWNSSFTKEETDDWHTVLKSAAKGHIQPELLISHRFALEDLGEGLEIMRDKTDEYVKIMIKI